MKLDFYQSYLRKYSKQYKTFVDESNIICIRAKSGTVQPHDLETHALLAVIDWSGCNFETSCDINPTGARMKANYRNKKLLQFEGVQILQEGDWEYSYLFPEWLLEEIEDILELKKKRRVSETQKQRLTTQLANYRNNPTT